MSGASLTPKTTAHSFRVLLARLHMDCIVREDSIRRARRILETLPVDVNSTYSDLLSRVYAQRKDQGERAKQPISWILCSTRPLAVSEIQCTPSVESSDTSMDEEALPDMESLISSCAGIVVLDETSHVVRFVHYTFQEYILREPPMPLYIMHIDIARTCLTYLLFEVFSTGRCVSDDAMDTRIVEGTNFSCTPPRAGQSMFRAMGSPTARFNFSL